ncbi:hypothetical protein MMC25_007319 [Agyrium rufum]|nr:hypothetical protein [Agyrium rufum]
MAETATTNKRQSMGGAPAPKVPVATPNIGGPAMASLETALAQAVGATIRVQTTLPNQSTIEGLVHSVSQPLSLLGLTTSSNPPAYHLLSISSIMSFNLLSLGPSSSGSAPLPPLDMPALNARLSSTLARLKAEESRRGPKGTSREAQDIFDALARTLPTEWRGSSIIVMERVEIKAPYSVGECELVREAGKESGSAHTLDRVKKVLENERRKLAERTNSNTKTAIPAAMPLNGPRKGG